MPDSIDPAADQEYIWDPGFHGSDIRHDLEQDHETYHPKAATGGYRASGSGRWIFLSKRSFHHQHVRIRHAAVFDLDTRERPAAQKYIVGIEKLTELQKKSADVNGDGDISVVDATLIQKYIVGLENFS